MTFHENPYKASMSTFIVIWNGKLSSLTVENNQSANYTRERKCLLRWVVRVNFAGHKAQHLVWGNEGTLPNYNEL